MGKIPRQQLEYLFYDRNKTVTEICTLLNVSYPEVRDMINEYGIDRRKVTGQKTGFEDVQVQGIDLNMPDKPSVKLKESFKNKLNEIHINYEENVCIGGIIYDFKVDNVVVEIDDYTTHNVTWTIKGQQPIPYDYHVHTSNVAKEHGLNCIHIFNWDNLDKIVRMLLPKQKIYARKCELREISQHEANVLLNEFHFQGRAKMQTVCHGLFYGEQLIQVMTWGKPRFNKNYQWELIRLCTRAGYMVVGGSDRLYKHFVDSYDPESILSYSDYSKFTGRVYQQLGLETKTTGVSSKHWYNPIDDTHVSDNGLRMRGFDLLLGDKYGRFGKGTSNETLMRSIGFVEIFDAGQNVYVWQKS